MPEGTNEYEVATQKAANAQIEKEIEEARENERKIIKCLLLGNAARGDSDSSAAMQRRRCCCDARAGHGTDDTALPRRVRRCW